MGGKRHGGSDFFKMIARDVFLLFFFFVLVTISHFLAKPQLELTGCEMVNGVRCFPHSHKTIRYR